jgi:hypothetical protein
VVFALPSSAVLKPAQAGLVKLLKVSNTFPQNRIQMVEFKVEFVEFIIQIFFMIYIFV